MKGRTAIVTGASRGIGLEIARHLVRKGANVTITGRNSDALVAAADSLGASAQVLPVAGHSGDPEHRHAAVAATIERFGTLDMLVNNTGVNPHYGPLVDASAKVLAKVFGTNVTGSLGWVQEAYSQAMSDGGGSIVNVSSLAGLRAAPNIGAYGASKAALGYVTQQLAVELAPTVRVNAVAPAVIRTQFAEKLFENEQSVAARYPLARIGSPADVAAAVVFLLSDGASWITGHTLVVDGGLSATGGIEE